MLTSPHINKQGVVMNTCSQNYLRGLNKRVGIFDQLGHKHKIPYEK
jgi:hypothetical protein